MITCRLGTVQDDNQGCAVRPSLQRVRVSLQSGQRTSLITPFSRRMEFPPRNFPNSYLGICPIVTQEIKNSSEESNETSEESKNKSEEFVISQVANQKYLRRNLGNSQVGNEMSSFLSCVSPEKQEKAPPAQGGPLRAVLQLCRLEIDRLTASCRAGCGSPSVA